MKNFFKKGWRERKKQYLCTRKTTGTVLKKMREVVEAKVL